MAKQTVLEILDLEDRTSAVPTDEETRQIAGYVSQVQVIDEEIERHESELKEAKATRRHVTTVDLPLAFQRLGIERMDLLGLSLTLRQVVSPNVAKEGEPAMHQWLVENGHGDLIKRVVKIPLGRGEDDTLELIEAYLQEQRVEYDVTEGVARNTLAAWARMMVQDGQELPDEIFNLWIGQECLLKEKK
jgi:hypothetical protein